MKIRILALIPVLLILAASCGEKKSSITPSLKTLNSFETLFGKGSRVNWDNSRPGGYEASFMRDKHAVKAYFDKDGSWLKTETELSLSELPAVVVKTIVGAFKGNNIVKVLLVKKSGEGITYRLFLKNGGQLSNVDLTTDGVILNNHIP